MTFPGIRGLYYSSLATNGFILQDAYHRLPEDDTRFKDRDVQKKFERFQKFVDGKDRRQPEVCESIHHIKKKHKSDNDVVSNMLGRRHAGFREDKVRIHERNETVRAGRVMAEDALTGNLLCGRGAQTRLQKAYRTGYFYILLDSEYGDGPLRPLGARI